jgi:hypothetical protein
MGAGKLYQAEIRGCGQDIRCTCCCCHAELRDAEVVREERTGNRTTYVVRCPNCSRFLTYYVRREAA